MGKCNQWGYTVTEAIGSTCNIRKLTGKGQVERKHRSKAYGHQKLKQKGNKGCGNGYPCTGLSLVGRKYQKASLRFWKVPEGLGSLGKVLVRLYKGYGM